MRIAVVADIHANLDALEAVLGRIDGLGVDEIVCLGDLVGYNAEPNECVAVIRDRKIRAVLGNHDVCASGLQEPDSFSPLARNAIFWTRERLTEENRIFLRDLPQDQRIGEFLFFHGSIYDENRYILSSNDAADNFLSLEGLPGDVRIGFFGHTHISAAFCDGKAGEELAGRRALALSPDKRYLINPGSVGQPRDSDPRAAFLVCDDRKRSVEFFRVAYDLRACQEKILRAGLPARLAERLERGR